MNQKIEMDTKKTRKYCDELNQIMKENKEDRVNRLNDTMYKVLHEGGGLYWHREVFIDCNGDRERMSKLVTESDKVHFEPSDDPDEHPGVVVRYNEKNESAKYDSLMDEDCVPLCDALNELPDVTTFESCCGHLERPYHIWFKTSNPYSVAVIARAIDRRYNATEMLWEMNVETLDSESNPQYCYNLHSAGPYNCHEQMRNDIMQIVENVKYWKSPDFYKYFKFN